MADFQGRTLSFKEKYIQRNRPTDQEKETAPLLLVTFSFRALSSSLPTLAHRREIVRISNSCILLVQIKAAKPGHIEKQPKRWVIHSTPMFITWNFFWNPICPENRKKPSSCSACTSNSAWTQGPFTLTGGRKAGKTGSLATHNNSHPTQRGSFLGQSKTAHPTFIELPRNDIEIYPKSCQGQVVSSPIALRKNTTTTNLCVCTHLACKRKSKVPRKGFPWQNHLSQKKQSPPLAFKKRM